jgi:hypothetical protein
VIAALDLSGFSTSSSAPILRFDEKSALSNTNNAPIHSDIKKLQDNILGRIGIKALYREDKGGDEKISDKKMELLNKLEKNIEGHLRESDEKNTENTIEKINRSLCEASIQVPGMETGFSVGKGTLRGLIDEQIVISNNMLLDMFKAEKILYRVDKKKPSQDIYDDKKNGDSKESALAQVISNCYKELKILNYDSPLIENYLRQFNAFRSVLETKQALITNENYNKLDALSASIIKDIFGYLLTAIEKKEGPNPGKMIALRMLTNELTKTISECDPNKINEIYSNIRKDIEIAEYRIRPTGRGFFQFGKGQLEKSLDLAKLACDKLIANPAPKPDNSRR